MGRKAEKEIFCGIIKLFKANEKPVDVIRILPVLQYTSLKIFEKIALRVKCGKKRSYISVNPVFNEVLKNFPTIKTDNIKSDPWVRIAFESKDKLKQLHPLLLSIYDEAELLSTAEQFGCCSRYEKCSDVKKCINPDQLRARGCMYRANLLNNRIFYGRNRNI